MVPRRTIAWLLVAAVLLPVAMVLLQGAGRLLAMMGDAEAAYGLNLVTVVLGVMWLVGLVAVVLALAINHLVGADESAADEP